MSFRPTSAETTEDQRRYTRARMVEVACLDCQVRVTVKKNSEHHTSIQWDAESVAQCTEFARQARQPGGRAVLDGCPRLGDSIERAVRDGRIAIGAEDGY